ncbi:rsh [Symbiodinium microadriaticum]|nr:rsh [Symbiodinium microadriaticum]
MIRQYELVERVRAYNPDCDEGLLNKAYVFAMRAHGSQKRHSGDPYFSHPLEVAGILTDLRLDTSSIATALLHDTLEDTLATKDELETTFGDEVTQLVEGVTKLSKLELSPDSNKQAENFRKLLVAMAKDIRVLLVKLADRLHNMRTLHHIPKDDKRRRIAQETLEIYAPLAGRIGMHEIREELEDLSFAVINPEARESITSRLDYLQAETGDVLASIEMAISDLMKDAGLQCDVFGRKKRPFSIWRKMERKDISFEQLSDIYGFRLIVEDEAACYQALGVLHQKWRVVPGRFKDYISTPKRNGYRSIHTTVIGPERQRVELQIRTDEMNAVAERGVAAHWLYKESDGQNRPADTAQLSMTGLDQGPGDPKGLAVTDPYGWIRGLIEMLDHGADAEEFLEHTKMEMFLDQVFCFTPKGDLIALPNGATPIDFAYAVHTAVGDSCAGAKINGRRLPLRTVLRNGDQVEITRSDDAHPIPAWEQLAITGRAKSAIRRFIRQHERSQYIELGLKITEKAADAAGKTIDEFDLKGITIRLGYDEPDSLLADVGRGVLTGQTILDVMEPDMSLTERVRKAVRESRFGAPAKSGAKTGMGPVQIDGLVPGLAVHYAPCCQPIPGDRIIGVMEEGKGTIIHNIHCEQLESEDNASRKWLDVSWAKLNNQQADDAVPFYTAGLLVLLSNERGALSSMAAIIADLGGNISNLHFTDRTQDYMEMQVDMEVENLKHLTSIQTALKTSPFVMQVKRAVLKEFRKADALLEGHFLLSSGLHSPIYLQCARVMMDPRRAAKLCKALAAKVTAEINRPIDVVVSPAMGGVLVGYEMARQLKVPSMFTERVEGEFQFRRGFELTSGANVLMVEDVVTTGLSSKECIASIKAHGGKVVGAASLIDRLADFVYPVGGYGGNILASAFGTAIGNPWTFPFIVAWILYLGQLILGRDTNPEVEKIPELGGPLESSGFAWINNIAENFFDVFVPMLVGGVPTGILAGIAAYIIIRPGGAQSLNYGGKNLLSDGKNAPLQVRGKRKAMPDTNPLAPLRLGVNIDHVATVRNARGGRHPDPLRAAEIVKAAGADGLTAHLREDRRHIIDSDIDRLMETGLLPLNFEMAATAEMQEIALRHRPHAACLVPEKREELTTEGGLDVVGGHNHLVPYIATLLDAGMRVSLFIDADSDQIKAASETRAPVIELHAGTYCDAVADGEDALAAEELERLQQGAKLASSLGLEVHAGHGIAFDSVKPIAQIPEIVELNIGHFLVGEAIFMGLEGAIREMRRLMDEARAELATGLAT